MKEVERLWWEMYVHFLCEHLDLFNEFVICYILFSWQALLWMVVVLANRNFYCWQHHLRIQCLTSHVHGGHPAIAHNDFSWLFQSTLPATLLIQHSVLVNYIKWDDPSHWSTAAASSYFQVTASNPFIIAIYARSGRYPVSHWVSFLTPLSLHQEVHLFRALILIVSFPAVAHL